MVAFSLAGWGAVAEFQEAGSFNATVAFTFSWTAFFFATTVSAWSAYHHLDYNLEDHDDVGRIVKPANAGDLVALAFIAATVCMGSAARLVNNANGITWFGGNGGVVGRQAPSHLLANDIANPAYRNTDAAATVHAAVYDADADPGVPQPPANGQAPY